MTRFSREKSGVRFRLSSAIRLTLRVILITMKGRIGRFTIRLVLRSRLWRWGLLILSCVRHHSWELLFSSSPDFTMDCLFARAQFESAICPRSLSRSHRRQTSALFFRRHLGSEATRWWLKILVISRDVLILNCRRGEFCWVFGYGRFRQHLRQAHHRVPRSSWCSLLF